MGFLRLKRTVETTARTIIKIIKAMPVYSKFMPPFILFYIAFIVFI